MNVREIVQSWYIREVSRLSNQAKDVVSQYFSDYTILLSLYYQGMISLNSYCSSVSVKKELWYLSLKLHTYFVKEKIKELQNRALHDLTENKVGKRDDILYEHLSNIFIFLLNEESAFVQKTIKNNCSDINHALSFVKKEKNVNDFLRCTERQRDELRAFFDKLGHIYSKLNKTTFQTCPDVISVESKTTKNSSSAILQQGHTKYKTDRKKKTKIKNIQKKNTIGALSIIQEENIENKSRKSKNESQSKELISNNRQTFSGTYSDLVTLSPSFYNEASIILDDFNMMIRINHGCNGESLLGLASNYIAPSFGNFIYNFERFHNKYDPDELYKKPVVSDKVVRYSHGYRWFGAQGKDYLFSLNEYGIVAKCLNLRFGDYKCYVPVDYDDIENKYVVEIEISDDILVSLLTERKDLFYFLTQIDIELRDFQILEISDKLLYLSKYYDLFEFLGLDNEELEEKEDVALRLQAMMSKISLEQFVWNSFSIEEKNDFLQQKLKTINNKEAYLRFNIVKAKYLKYSKEIEISYLIHSEYSVEVYVSIDIKYKDGTVVSYPHNEVESYDDNFEFFQGYTRIQNEQDCINIVVIELNCSDC